MKKSIIMVLLLVSQVTNALNGALFNVSASGNQTTRPSILSYALMPKAL